MISFDILWETMKKRGFSTYRLRETCLIDSRTIKRLRENKSVETKTLDKICNALDCSVEDIMTHIKLQ
jgi:DNA-binding Xre family transcriptional regulator